MQVEVQTLQHLAMSPRILEGHVAKLESALDRPRRGQGVGPGFDSRPHFKESQQISKEQRLVGDAGKRRKDLLYVAARLQDGVRQEVERPDTHCARDRSPDHVSVGGIVSGSAYQR